MYRALWTADVHVGNTLPYARRVNTDGFASYTDRLMDSLAVLDQMADYAEANGITDLWFIGDLLDKRLLDAATLKAAMEKVLALADRGLFIRMVPGNHESQDAAGSMYTLRGFEGVRNNIEVWDEKYSRLEVGGFVFRGIPYKPDEIAREHVNRIRDEEANNACILLVHQSLVGGKVGSWINPDGLAPEDLDGFKSVLAGHFHTPQRLSVSPLRMYLGAPIQHNFGDTKEQRGFWDIGFGKGGQCKLVRTVSPEFHVWDWSKLADISSPPPEFKRGDYIQLEARGTSTELKRIAPDFENVVKGAMRLGARAVKPRLIPAVERKARAKVAEEGGKVLTWPEAVAGYIDACDVSGLSRARLEALAREALEAADG